MSEWQDNPDGDSSHGDGASISHTTTYGSTSTYVPFQDEEPSPDPQTSPGMEMSLTELFYSMSSYHAIVKPVSLTMIMAALAVVIFNTEDSIAQGEELMADAYQVWSVNSSDGGGQTMLKSLGNSFIIVSVFCAMTFVIVGLYKFRCMKFLIGYMVFSSATLLGILGATMLEVGIERYRFPVDAVTFYGGMYNFAVVGVVAIFGQVGVPAMVTQGYLVCTSVILAWQLSHFDEWTAWSLLIMLALYDLCAVLTPCGPLKALVHLMSQEDSPTMPGLLYEAELPQAAQRPGSMSNPRTSYRPSSSSKNNHTTNATGTATATNSTPTGTPSRQHASSSKGTEERPFVSSVASGESSVRVSASMSVDDGGGSCSVANESIDTSSYVPPSSPVECSNDTVPLTPMTALMPFALANFYKLTLVSPPPLSPIPAVTEATSNLSHNSNSSSAIVADDPQQKSSSVSMSPLLEHASEAKPKPRSEYSPAELRTIVEARLPDSGGRIEMRDASSSTPHYVIFDKDGVERRTLMLDKRGKIFEVVNDDDSVMDGSSNSIKLGLGDFIFYSVLVAKAVQYSFCTFAACMLVILAGLGGTLVLLSVYHQALPALPISIFLGVAFYVLTRLMIEPWIETLLSSPLYV